MSLNIETTSDKPNFINYFSDPLTLPQYANVVLTKTNLSVPIIVSPLVRMPLISVANRVHTAIQVGIDGVVGNITWTDLYTAANWYFVNNYGLDRIDTAAKFFSGTYEFVPNQQIVLNCIDEGAALGTATSNKMKVGFNQILAKAINDKFLFYNVEPAPTYKKAEGVDISFTNRITTPLIDAGGVNNITGFATDYNDDILTELGLNIAYDSASITATTPTDFNWSAASSLTNWTRTGADIITSAVAGVNVAFATQHGTPFSIDPNGGWVGTVPTLAGGGTMAYGLSLSGEFGGWDNNFLSGGGTTCDDYINLIDIGWKFKANANGTTCAQIIDSKTDNAAYTGAAATLPQIPITEPPHLVHIATAGEKFFIHIKRGAIVNGTTEFIFSLFSGTAAILETTDNLIYVCKRTFAGGSLRPTLVALSDNVLGNILSGWNYIPITTQSLEQGDYFQTTPYGGTSNRSVYLEPKYTGLVAAPTDIIMNFWRSWGLISYENAVIPTADQRRYFTNKSTGTHLLRTFKNPVNILNTSFNVNYIIGQNDISKIWSVDDTGVELIMNQDFTVSNLPAVLHVSIDNLDLKNFNGTLLGGAAPTGGNTGQTGQRPSVDRTIGTIPLPTNTIIASDNYLLQYEPLNLIYRPINNPISFTINQLQVGIFYYDFLTNIRQNLNAIEGICNLELNIKQGFTPKKPQNNLLPY